MIIQTFMKPLLMSSLMLFVCAQCISDKKSQFYEPEEANMLILSAIAARDLQCGTNHFLTEPLWKPADKEEVDVCVAGILAIDCSEWNGGNPLPELCLAILVDI